MRSYFRLARNTALKSPSRFRLGAVLVKGHKPISVGFNNMLKSHPLMDKHNTLPWPVGIHAEVHSCLGVPVADLIGCDIYVYRVLKNGKAALAKPCKTCRNFLKSVGVDKAFYTTGVDEEWNVIVL